MVTNRGPGPGFSLLQCAISKVLAVSIMLLAVSV